MKNSKKISKKCALFFIAFVFIIGCKKESSISSMNIAQSVNISNSTAALAPYVRTIAGTGVAGSNDGNGTVPKFHNPSGCAVDLNGNIIVADALNHVIRKITPAGIVSTIAGTGFAGKKNGPALSAQFNQPTDVAIDGSGIIYVVDQGNCLIRRISTTGGVTTMAGSTQGFLDGIGTAAKFNFPSGIAVDPNGDLIVTDRANCSIRKIDRATKQVTTIAGNGTIGFADGTGSNARFNFPQGIDIDNSGIIMVADVGNNRIRKITSLGIVTTFAGGNVQGHQDGTIPSALFSLPSTIDIDQLGNIFITEEGNYDIREFPNGSGTVVTIAGSVLGYQDGTSTNAKFSRISGIAIDISNNIILSDLDNNCIRKSTYSGVVSTIVGVPEDGYQDGDKNAAIAKFDLAVSNVLDNNSNIIIVDENNHLIRKMTHTGIVTTIAGSSVGYSDGTGSNAKFFFPSDADIDLNGDILIADQYNNCIRKISSTGTVSTFAGSTTPGHIDGPIASAQFNHPFSIVVDPSGNIYVSDNLSNWIRKISTSGIVSTVAGTGVGGSLDGSVANAQFHSPEDLAIDKDGNLIVADFYNGIRKINFSTGMVSTLVSMVGVHFVVIDNTGEIIFSNGLTKKVYKIDLTGTVATYIGDGSSGHIDSGFLTSEFTYPAGLSIDVDNSIILCDGNYIRKCIRGL